MMPASVHSKIISIDCGEGISFIEVLHKKGNNIEKVGTRVLKLPLYWLFQLEQTASTPTFSLQAGMFLVFHSKLK